MFQKLSVVLLTVLLSTTASAQTKKKKAKKAPAKTAVEAPAKAEEPLPETPPTDVAPAETPAAETVSAPAATASGGTEFNRQPNGGSSDFNVSLGYNMMSKVDGKNAAGAVIGNSETSGIIIKLSYDYGLTANNSLGIATDYGMLTEKQGSTDLKTAGLGDIFITSKNRTAMGGWNLNYGLGLGFGAKAKGASSGPPAVEGTRASGGMSIPLYVGGEWAMGESWLGVRLDYGFLMERSVDSAGDPKLTGGNPMSLKLFWESVSWNIYGGFVSVGESKYKVGSLPEAAYQGALSGMLFGAGWWTHMSPGMLMGLSYDLTMWGERDYVASGYKLAAQMQHDLGVRFRWEF